MLSASLVRRCSHAAAAAFVTAAVLAPPAWAQCEAEQIAKILPDDDAADDRFGVAVAIDGGTAIVGAPNDDDNGPDSGSAYVFDVATGQQLAKLFSGDVEPYDHFGGSVAISGETVIVGAPGDDDNGEDSGSAYLFDVATGQQLAKLLPDDGAAGDIFGSSVAIDGDAVIVGASGNDDNGPNSGSAYLFDVATGAQLAKLLPDDGTAGDRFGGSVAISGGTAIIGARNDDDNGLYSGSAYLFDVPTGQQLAKLLPDDVASGDFFGRSVAIDGDAVIVGAYRDGDNGTNSGSAYLFDVATGQQLAKLLSDDGEPHDWFGISVSIDGDTAIVGARDDDDNGLDSGSAYVFDVALGQQRAKLLPDDGAAEDRFGVVVAFSGGTAIIGAPRDDDNGLDSGSACLFDVVCACPADFNNDGDVNTIDVLAFLNAWAAGDPEADCNADSTVNTLDVLCFLNLWAAGC